MKKKKSRLPKWIGGLKIEMKQELDLKTVLHTALDKYTVKDLLDYMFVVSTQAGFMYGMSMVKFLANEKDVENVKAMVFLKYMLDNWDNEDFLKKAAKSFGRAMKKAEARVKKKQKS